MKIAVYSNLTSGGAQRTFTELTKRLAKKHKLDFYNLNLPIPRQFFKAQGFSYTKLDYFQRELAQKIDNKHYDVVLLSHDYLTKSPLLLRYLKTPTVYLCHEPFREFYEPASVFSRSWKHKLVNLFRLPLKWIDEANIGRASVVVANSRYSQKRLTEVYHRKITKIPLGVDSKKFVFKNLPRENFFLSVGALARFKGMDFLVRAIGLLPREYRYPLAVAANGGRDEQYIKNLAKALKVKLVIKRQADDKELVRLYNKARLFLYAPYYEPFGLVALEAMACGLPVIGVKEGGLPEIVTVAKNGWLTTRDINKFSSVIMQGLREADNKFRQKTVDSIKKWNWENSVEQLEKILSDVR
jgi:glycosyltransferase involved in cell wall biosynthesis